MGKRINNLDLLSIYSTIKSIVIESGYSYEIKWQELININIVDKEYFAREAAWVILSSGMKESIIRVLFKEISIAFLNWSTEDIAKNYDKCRKKALKIFNHRKKINAIIYIITQINKHGFSQIRNSIIENSIDYISSLPYMGPATSYHFAKNLGMDVVKPDRHLLRISSFLGFDSPIALCQVINNISGDKLSVVDLIFWRYATINKDYLVFIKDHIKSINNRAISNYKENSDACLIQVDVPHYSSL